MANPNFSSKILIRKLEDDSIVVFYDKHSIYVKSKMGILVFHRWFAQKGYYIKNFKPFSEIAKRKKHLTAKSLLSASQKYGVNYSVGTKIPQPKSDSKEINFISEKGTWTRRLTADYYTEKEKQDIFRKIGYDKIKTED
nr:MAG TPA: hypothetical protein [Caudoviricetes sp.]